MKKIKIIEYNHKYAEAVAEMWQNSNEGWLGETFLTSAQDVITDEENSIHLKAWLAMAGELVVGYCNLYEYQEDTGALYIGLLNVRDDYHGKKIGKKLVLTAVQKTIELGWDRLDLYTWSGNTKAVPLYKKTGFFWEDRDDSTHLINLIPSALKNELIKDYFTEINWYEDSIRHIEVVPDGRKENEFEYLTYEWQKSEKYLLLEYSRRGRGLRKIETDEYAITATVENLKLVFGKKYKIRYDIVNKTNEPLEISLKGIDEKNISFDLDKKLVVKDELSFNADFFVDKVAKEQNVWKTHPCIITEVELGGKKTNFRIGIEPIFPAKISLSKRSGICFTNTESDIYLDIENNFDENVIFEFTLPKTEWLEFPQDSFCIALKAKEKRSVPTKYILRKSGVYSPEITVIATRKNGESLSFYRRINSVFQTMSGVFYGKHQTYFIIGNGKYKLLMEHTDFINNFRIGDISSNRNWCGFRFPKLGKPYSDEFNKRKCDKVEHKIEGSTITLKVYFSSEKFKGISFVIAQKLFANGIVERWFEFENINFSSDEKLFLKDSLGFGTSCLTLPYNNEIIEMKEDVIGGTGNWDADNFTENWLFSKHENESIGVCWSNDTKMRFGGWEKFFEYDLSNLKKGEKWVTNPVKIAINTFSNAHNFREFAMQHHFEKSFPKQDMELCINNGNPFVDKQFQVEVIENKKKNYDGNVIVKMGTETILSGEFSEKKPISKITETVAYNADKNYETVTLNTNLNDVSKVCEKVIFPIAKSGVNCEKFKLNGKEILRVDNGIISLETSSDFAPTLHSLKFQKREWLDSSFPKPCSKSWWKPWIGGIYSIPERMNLKSILAEDNSAKLVKKNDVLGNEWEGFCITTEIVKNAKLKGLKIEQFFLLLPKSPIMLHTVKIYQNTGEFMVQEPIETNDFIKPDADLKNCSFISQNSRNEPIKVNAGHKMNDLKANGQIVYCGKNNSELLQVYLFSNNTQAYLNADLQVLNGYFLDKITCENNAVKYLAPRFYLFVDEILDAKMLKDLMNVRFED